MGEECASGAEMAELAGEEGGKVSGATWHSALIAVVAARDFKGYLMWNILEREQSERGIWSDF